MSRFIFLIGFFAVAPIATTARAENCELKVVMSTYERTSSYHSDYRLAKFVKEADWNELSKGAAASGKIYGVPTSGSYNEYRKAYNSIEQQFGQSLTEDQAQQIFWTGLDKSAADAYQKCLESSIFNQFGLHLAVVEGNVDAVLLKVRWTNFPGTNSGPIKIKWTVPKIEGIELQAEMDPGDNYVSVARPKSGGVILAASYNGVVSEVVKIVAIPPPAPKPIDNCVLQRSADVCLRCEFNVDDVVATGSSSQDYTCQKMPAGVRISAKTANLQISLAAAGDCWLDIRMKGPNEAISGLLSYAGACPAPIAASGSSSFVKSTVDGVGHASFYVEKCGSGKLCRLKGKLVLEAEDPGK
ncbi:MULTISPECIES: hypothetical protein [unclassified Bradyrhizobium]|uniref:hypothetical protein n=1 Tax=unclassified Bradyrhizobium TaxID=2631580 RepID=UPI0028E4F707|nr:MULTISPECIES: hypothetical protein [unclassified Bradyrhizobium]